MNGQRTGRAVDLHPRVFAEQSLERFHDLSDDFGEVKIAHLGRLPLAAQEQLPGEMGPALRGLADFVGEIRLPGRPILFEARRPLMVALNLRHSGAVPGGVCWLPAKTGDRTLGAAVNSILPRHLLLPPPA